MKKEDLPAYIGIAGFYALLQFCGITCPIKFLTGISCAGCGLTRAWLAAIRLDFAAAFSYHPLFFMAIPMLLMLFFRQRLSAVRKKAGWSIIILAFLICYVLRMADSSDSVVVFDPAHGLIGKIITGIQKLV